MIRRTLLQEVSWVSATDVLSALVAALLVLGQPAARTVPEPAPEPLPEVVPEVVPEAVPAPLPAPPPEPPHEDLAPRVAELRAEITLLDQQMEALAGELQQLEETVAALEEAAAKEAPESEADPAALASEIESLQAQRDALAADVAALVAQLGASSDEVNLPQFTPSGALKPVYLLLVKNGVMPITTDYFSVKNGYVKRDGKLVRATQFTREKDGQDVARALADGGCLATVLVDLDPQSSYIRFLVCEDSIDCLRAISQELRKRKVAWTWDPSQDTPLVGTDETPGEGWVER